MAIYCTPDLTRIKKYFSAWGNFPIKFGELYKLKTVKEIQSFLFKKKSFIPVGNFRSYGDCALNKTMVKYDPNKNVVGLARASASLLNYNSLV